MKSSEDIRNNFKNHIATLTKVNDTISILDWRAPGTVFYAVRYVMDGRHLYITGDLGTAVFELTWTATLESFKDIEVSYFHEKLSAFTDDKFEFDSDSAQSELQDFFDEYDEEKNYTELLESLKQKARSCENVRDWAEVINESNEDIAEFDNDYWEWIYKIGRVVPTRVRAYLIGLNMAAEQLKSK